MPYRMFGCAFVGICLAGPAVLTAFRRAARKASFRAPIRFKPRTVPAER
ncbi:hypothetical protein [Streptomyces sp. G1]